MIVFSMDEKKTNGQPNAARKNRVPIWLLIPLDVCLTAGCLLGFAYLHHVRPQVIEVDPNHSVTANIPALTKPTGTTTTMTVAAQTTAPQSEHTSGETGTTAPSGGSGTQGTITADTGGGTGVTPNVTNPTKPSTVTTTVTTPAPKPDLSGWGAKFPDKFMAGYDVVQTENSYRSHDLNISIKRMNYLSSVAYVADIYIRDFRNFAAAFAKDQFGRSIYENGTSIMQRNNAVLGVNGDYYANRDTGEIIRNGVLYRDVAKGDVGCLYWDGTFRSFGKNEFNAADELQAGLWQSMSFGPALVRNGQAVTGWSGHLATEQHPRTGFGCYEPGHYVMVVVDGRQDGYSVGLNGEEWTRFFTDLGVSEAYNLDGGASSQMYFCGKLVNKPSGGSVRALSDMFLIKEVG